MDRRTFLAYLGILAVIAFPSFAFAQDGSAPPKADEGSPDTSGGGSADGSAIVPAEPAAETESAAQAAPGTPAETAPRPPSPDPVLLPAVTPAENAPASPAAATPEAALLVAPLSAPEPVPEDPPILLPISAEGETPTEKGSGNPYLVPILAALAVIPFGFFVAGKLKKKKTEEERDGSRCFALKHLLEEKLKELTDLKGRLKGEAVALAKGKVRESVAGTAAGDALAAVERAEKEYARLKKLYEECMIEFGPRKNAVIIHGCPSSKEEAIGRTSRSYDRHWLPWIKEALAAKGMSAAIPLMPEPWAPDYEKFKAEFEKHPVDERSVLIGHSCGCAFLVRWLGETKRKVAKLVLVAPWKIGKPGDAAREAFYEYEIDPSIKERVESIVMFTSDDEEEDGKRSLEMFHRALGGKVVELKGKGHYTFGEMGTEEFPELLDAAL